MIEKNAVLKESLPRITAPTRVVVVMAAPSRSRFCRQSIISINLSPLPTSSTPLTQKHVKTEEDAAKEEKPGSEAITIRVKDQWVAPDS